MKILALTAENVKRLVAVHIEPDGSLVQITGRNGAGKTSVLDSIWWALAGASHIQAAPIRNGASKARIRLDLGELVVTRTFNRRGKDDGEKVTTSLTVESADGAIFRSPQKMLDDLLGELSFDPLKFARAPAKEQIETLKRFVPDLDFEAIEAANRDDYESRRDIGRELKALRARLEALTVPGDPRQERVDESALVEALAKAGEHNADIEQRKTNRERVEQERDAKVAEAAKLREEAQRMIERAEIVEQGAEALTQKLADAPPLPDPMDTTEIRVRIEQARETNRAVAERDRAIEERDRLQAEVEQSEQKVEALTIAMEQRNEQKAKAIAEAEIPVRGLAFGAGEVTLNGVPFEQASDAEQLRTSVAIAAALNPQLRVIRIRDGSLLDEDGMRLLAELAEAQDFQVWVERVDSSGKLGFVIEDGALVAKETEAA